MQCTRSVIDDTWMKLNRTATHEKFAKDPNLRNSSVSRHRPSPICTVRPDVLPLTRLWGHCTVAALTGSLATRSSL